ncbi:hypothetical protein [Mesorhizobium sp. B2-8-9]|uniref:hypothetical protein n=1 Tax=Mesorhizobium sp. B2-8-9 TaxID=2589899 RepID=UPI00112AC19F|nr:hypothetical protein [Mesorhizobium sp. B2-8-9]TPI67873.1 hypothetical protein FJ423_32170 [Mesorhizobium sp. B2-8-9]
MKIHIICMTALLLSLSAASAFAGFNMGTSALDDPAKMSPFFTDAGMKTIRSGDEFKKAWMQPISWIVKTNMELVLQPVSGQIKLVAEKSAYVCGSEPGDRLPLSAISQSNSVGSRTVVRPILAETDQERRFSALWGVAPSSPSAAQ